MNLVAESNWPSEGHIAYGPGDPMDLQYHCHTAVDCIDTVND